MKWQEHSYNKLLQYLNIHQMKNIYTMIYLTHNLNNLNIYIGTYINKNI